MHALVSASLDLSAEAHAVKFTGAQRRVACKNRLVELFPGFFCQLTHPLHPGDGENLNLAGHARLGERVHEHRQHAADARPRPQKIGPSASVGIPGCVSWRKIFVIFGARKHKLVLEP